MAALDEDWKQKYRELALELEQQQSASMEQIESLSQIVNSMVLALEGDDPLLDADLLQLREMVSENAAGTALRRVGKNLDKKVRARDSEREKQVRKVLEALQRWIQQLRDATRHPPVLNILDTYEQRSLQLQEAYQGLPSLLSDLVELQRGVALEGVTGSAGSAHDEHSEQISVMLRNVAKELSSLLSGLYLPAPEHEASRNLMQKIDQGIELTDLPELLRQIVGLVAKVKGGSSEEFENYLLELSSQLAAVEEIITDSRQDHADGHKHSQQLDQDVRNNVAQMHQALASSHDLEGLKSAVAGRLTSLLGSMDQFRQAETVREQRLMSRYESLLQKVEMMEKETLEVQSNMEAERLRATTDALTGLPNRAAYDERIKEALSSWQRYQTPFSVVVGDLDYFKTINDSYGHLAGDKVLRLIAKVLRARLRNSDFVARYGGEEFVVIMPSTQLKAAYSAVEKIRATIAKSPFNFHGKPVTVSMSFGVAEVLSDDDEESVFGRADKMLYKAKEAGRNCVCYN